MNEPQNSRAPGSAPAIDRVACRLSIVVPCYNEAEVLPETVSRLRTLLDRLTTKQRIAANSQIIFIDDGSGDRTWDLIRDYHDIDDRVRGLRLSANRGHQTALIAGLFAAEGDAVVSIDADLQDDTNAIESMVDEFRAGSDVVYGVRVSREADTVFKRCSAELYYKVLRALGVRVVHNHADFRLLSRRALEALKCYPEVHLYLRGIVPLIGFRSSSIRYSRRERFAGESKYPLRKMLALAVDGVTSFTAFPLRLIAIIGIVVSFLSIGMILWVLWVKLFSAGIVPGWASSVIPVYFLGGIQLMSLGILGEYLAKLYAETKRRPRFFIDEQL
jgi:polyisoprenyl-phosphate glycosyltransferase